MKSFSQALQSDRLTVTADLTLNTQSGADDIARQVDLLGPHVAGLQVTDNPWAWVQMSATSAASLVLQRGLDVIPILTCRDRNRIALMSDLLGLRALGVGSVILTRGHKIPQQHQLKAQAVFDVSGRELVSMAAQLGESDPPAPGKEFFIGIGARAFRASKGWDAESLTERAKAGARFLQTQLCFNTEILRQYLQALVATRMTWKYSVIVSLTVLPSAQTALWLKKHLSDSRIPKGVIERLEKAHDPQAEGIALCAELMREIAEIPGVSGINLMTVGDADSLREAITLSGLG